MSGTTSDKINTELRRTIPWSLVAIFLIFSAAIVLAGSLYYKSQKNRIYKEQENNLSAIATLKINQIINWRRERLGDAAVISLNKPLIRSIEQYYKGNNKEVKTDLYEWMNSVRKEYDYSNILLVDSSFKVRMSVVPPDSVLGDSIKTEIKRAIIDHKLFMTDLHHSKEIRQIHIEIMIPLFDSVKKISFPVGTVILRIDPGKVLFPLIRSWPTLSKSSETLLLRREKDSVVYLNELRFLKNAALKLKLSLTNKNLLGTKAINGLEGVTEGTDYRNIRVVGSIHKIPGTSWYMVAKVDKEEILSPLRRYVLLITIVVVLLILINASIFGSWIWRQRISFYRSQLKNEVSIRELEERFTTAFRMSPVSVTISSVANNKFIDVNNTFLDDMEYTREEVIGKTAHELDIWADEEEREWLIKEIGEKGKIFGKVLSFRTKSGKVIYGLASMSVVNVNGQLCNISTTVNITEKRKSEEKLVESEELFRKLFENMLNGFSYCKMIFNDKRPVDFIYLRVNEAFGSLTGLIDVEGRRVSDVIPGILEADPELLERYGRVALTGKPEVFEMYVESLKMWFSISVYSPKKEYFVAVFDVITARKLAENDLLASEERYRVLVDQASDGIFISDLSGNYINVNIRGCAMLGYSQEEILLMNLRDLIPPEDLTNIPVKWEELREGKTVMNERRMIRKDGSLLQVEISARMFPDGRLQGIARDITERKLVEEKLRESEMKFRQTFDLSPIGIVMVGLDKKFLRCNDSFSQSLGFKMKELAGKTIADVTHPEDISIGMDDMIAIAKGELESSHVQKRYLRKDGEIVWGDVLISLIRSNSGEPQYFLAIIQDITESKKIVEALRESEERFRSLYENVTIGIYRTTLDGRILMANPAMVSMLGFDTFEQLALRNLQEEGYEPDYPRSQFLESIERDGRIIGLESAWNRRNGKALIVRESANAVRDDKGRILYYDGTVEDITERKKTEEALRESEERFSKSFRTSPISFMIANLEDGRIIEVNDAFTTISGFTRDEALASTTLDLKIWVNIQDRKQMIDSLRKGSAILHQETHLRSKEGKIAIVLLSAQVIKLANRNCIISSIEDITVRKRAEEALRESEERFRSMANSIPQLAWVAHADGFIYWYNQRWYEYTGKKPEQMEGWGWKIVHDPEVLPKVMENWSASIASGQPFEMSFPLRGADGQFRTFLTRVEPWKDSEGTVLQWFGTNTDVETLKQAEEKIRLLNSELDQRVQERTSSLEAANKELEAFSYSVSHDLRAPLRSVHGFTKILIEDHEANLDEEGKRICGIISSSATQMGELIDDLLSFSRIGRSSLNPSEMDMKKMAKNVFEGLTSPAERKRIKLNIGQLQKAFGDVTLFGQVWTNLISNAIKYTSKNDVSEINIGSKAEGKRIIYFIKDDGVGFDMQYAHKLFGVFQRLHSEIEFEGNGVGLAIVQRIILKHGGKVWAEGEVGKGATFYFSLPVNGADKVIR